MTLALLGVLACALAIAPTALAEGEVPVVDASFEGSVAGWQGYRSSLAAVSGGVEGAGAARVAFRSSTGQFSIYLWPRVGEVEPGTLYVADAWVKGRTAGRTMCLRVRELASWGLVGAARRCLTSTGSWQRFPSVRYWSVGKSTRLGLAVYQRAGRSGDRFALDGVHVTGRKPTPPPPDGTSYVANGSFEGSLDGWAGYRSSLSLASDGIAGPGAARVSLDGSATDFSIYSPQRQVASTVAGAAYSARAWVRSDTPGRPLCLRIREWAALSEAGAALTCLTGTSEWQQFPTLTYTARGTGRELDAYVYQGDAQPGDSFEVDGVALVAGTSVPDTSGDPPPTTDPTAPDRWYSDASPFNQRIAADAAADPSSAEMVRTLVSGGRLGFAISAKAWTAPVYYANADTRKYTVSLTASWAPKRALAGVPIPANAQPDPEGDAHLTIMDPATGCEYDFWQARKNADGSWSASWGNATYTTGTGVLDGGWATTASGFANALGKMRPEDFAAGAIPHALVFAFPYTKAGGPVRPATSSDGKSTVAGAIPEGARLQLDPGLDLDSLGLNRWQKVVARALQEYGMFLGDTGGTVGLSAINARSYAGTPYPWGDVDYAYMPTSLLEHMRVLKLGPQYKPTGWLENTPCATFQ